jgi:predicted enzyme related to lactoylglutathione lyase
MSPTRANGKICYIEIPATDIPRSAAFYEALFGWRTRQRTDGNLAFDDACHGRGPRDGEGPG